MTYIFKYTHFPKFLTKAEKRSLLAVESCFASCAVHVDAAIMDWQVRASSGRVLGKFKQRVRDLIAFLDNKYYSSTDGSIMNKERIERGRLLVETVQVAATNIFNQQTSLLQSQAIAKFKKSLQQLAREHDVIPSEISLQMMRQTLFDFRNNVLELELDEFALSSEPMQGELSALLQELLKEYPESTSAKLASISNMDRKVERSNQKKKGKVINIGLSMVGMLRPPGYGNLQGYAGYATSLLGMPLELLFGIQNDGDALDGGTSVLRTQKCI